MKKYTVMLSRCYLVSVEAEDEEKAMISAEFFLGNFGDDSTEEDRLKYNFQIGDIEMTVNDAIGVEEADD